LFIFYIFMSGHFPLLYEKNFVRNRILTERYLHQNSSTELYVFNVLALQINCVRIDSFSFFYSCFDDKNIFFKLKVLASISDFGQRLFDYEFVRLSISFMTEFVFFSSFGYVARLCECAHRVEKRRRYG